MHYFIGKTNIKYLIFKKKQHMYLYKIHMLFFFFVKPSCNIFYLIIYLLYK